MAATDPRKTVLVSAVALMDGERRVLLAERPAHKHMGGMWEFPGGKVEAGETPQAALVRELAEELGIAVEEAALSYLTEVVHAYDNFTLHMTLFACRNWHGTPHPHEGQRLQWAHPQDMASLPMPPADVPLVAFLQSRTI